MIVVRDGSGRVGSHRCGAGISGHRATTRAAATLIETTRGLLIDGNKPAVSDSALACCSDRTTATASSSPRLLLRLIHTGSGGRERAREIISRRENSLERSIAARVMIPAIKQTGNGANPRNASTISNPFEIPAAAQWLNPAARHTKPRTRCRARLSTTAKLGDRTRMIAACTMRGAEANRGPRRRRQLPCATAVVRSSARRFSAKARV
jgi:hypothetical protein